MKDFKCVVMSKQSTERLWVTVRDQMPELAAMLDDIDRVTVIDRRKLQGGRIQLVNEWRAKPRFPISLESVIGSDTFVWLDHAEWIDASQQCQWRIEPEFLSGRIHCHGTTGYEPAMGGRGCKVTFQGQLHVDAGAVGGAGKLLERSLVSIVESVVTVMIPKNFRRIVEAAERRLQAGP
jgi:hypothetical protein